MQSGENGEGERGAQKDSARNPYPARRPYGKQQRKEHGGDLREGIGFAKDAGAQIAQSGDGKQHGTGGQDGNIAAEHQHRKLPRNLVQDRQHQKHGAQQELVRDGVEILAEQSLLVQFAGQQTVEAVAESRDHEENQGPEIAGLDEFNQNKRNKN